MHRSTLPFNFSSIISISIQFFSNSCLPLHIWIIRIRMSWIEHTYIRNSGNCLYLLNSFCHSSSVVGGLIPLMRCQSTIDKPDSVSRVTPPRTTAPTTCSAKERFNHISEIKYLKYLFFTIPQQLASHHPTIFWPGLATIPSVTEPDLRRGAKNLWKLFWLWL